MSLLKDYIYLDYNATAPMLPGVYESMEEVMLTPTNPSALHGLGQHAKRLISGARRTVAEYVEAHPDMVIFTSGGTEANNLVLQGGDWKKVLTTAVEHDSVHKALEGVEEVPVDAEGLVQLPQLEQALEKVKDGPALLSVILAHNESGVIQPMEEIVAIAKKYGVYVHVDGVQALGKIPLSFRDLDVDFMTLSSHKIGGPQGVGVLIARGATLLSPRILGGGQERNYRSGTENVSGIVGFAKALEKYSMDHLKDLKKWHAIMEEDLEAFCRSRGQPMHVYSKNAPKLPNTTCLAMPHVESATQVMRFDLNKVAVSMGAACSSGRTQVSRSLAKMGPSPELAKGAIRVSSGWNTLREDLEFFATVWKEIYCSLEQRNVS